MGKFTFGMYKGKDIDTIIKVNPKYVLWAERNVSYFSLTQEQHNACVLAIKPKLSYFDRMETRERAYSDDYDDIDEYSADYENDMRSCYMGTTLDTFYPATKEQCDLFFSKMKQAGYEWNNENKKLCGQILKITPKFCVGQVITDDNGTWYKITNIKCLDDWYYKVYDVAEDNTHFELCSIIDEKFRENRFVSEIKKMMGD